MQLLMFCGVPSTFLEAVLGKIKSCLQQSTRNGNRFEFRQGLKLARITRESNRICLSLDGYLCLMQSDENRTFRVLGDTS